MRDDGSSMAAAWGEGLPGGVWNEAANAQNSQWHEGMAQVLLRDMDGLMDGLAKRGRRERKARGPTEGRT